jgi:hypothetical protein
MAAAKIIFKMRLETDDDGLCSGREGASVVMW